MLRDHGGKSLRTYVLEKQPAERFVLLYESVIMGDSYRQVREDLLVNGAFNDTAGLLAAFSNDGAAARPHSAQAADGTLSPAIFQDFDCGGFAAACREFFPSLKG